MKFMKYLKVFLYILIPFFIFDFLLAVLYYFNIFSGSIHNYMKLFTIAISLLVGGIYIGTKASKQGWLEGIKVGLEIIFLFFLLRYLAFDKGMDYKMIVYYGILLVSSVLGSMIGINKRKVN